MEEIVSAAAKSPLTPAEVLEAQARYEAYADETDFIRASRNTRVGHEATQPARNGFATPPPAAAEEDDLAEQARKGTGDAVPRFDFEEGEGEHGAMPAGMPGMHEGEKYSESAEHGQPEPARQGTPVSPENDQVHGTDSYSGPVPTSRVISSKRDEAKEQILPPSASFCIGPPHCRFGNQNSLRY